MGEKTEKATPKKLRDARKKGQVAKSQDVPAVATFVVSMGVTLAMAPKIYDDLTSFIFHVMDKIATVDMVEEGVGLFVQGLSVIFFASFPIVVLVALVGAFTNFFMVGPMFATEVFKFDIKKFDPVQNLKNKFKIKTLVELLKSLIKISAAAYICYRVVMDGMDIVISAVGQPVHVSLEIISHFLLQVLIRVGLLFLFVAAADWFFQKHNFEKEMMMEKFEVKQEYKNTEGDPEIKGKRREVAREIAYGGGPSSPVGAKAIVTNPTHLAVAIGYKKEYPAPFIMSKGKGADAEYIIRIAQKEDIPIMRNVPLAHTLFERCDEFTYVPVETYEAIAEILKWVESLEQGQEES